MGNAPRHGIPAAVMPRRTALRWLAAAALTPLAACTPGADLPVLPDMPETGYTLGIDDAVRIIIIGGDQLNDTFRIGDTGDIALPLLGRMQAAGRTPAELQQDIADTLTSRKLFRNPSVSVEVVSYRSIYILGEVAKPGKYAYQPGMTLLTAVSVAGGFTYRAVTGYASVVRTEGTHEVEGRIGRQSFIRPGDVVTIFERLF